MKKILLAGEVLAETQYQVDKIPVVGEVGWVSDIKQLTSSKIVNAGRILASKNKVDMLGVVGVDDERKKVYKDLKRYGIDSSLVYTTPKSRTGQVVVMTNKKGQSAFVLYLSAADYFDGSKLKSLKGYEYIYMATSMKLPELYKIIKRANKDGVEVFLDFPNKQKEIDKNKLRTVDFIVPNREEAQTLLDLKIRNNTEALDAVTKLKSYTDGIAIITLDKEGCVVFGKDWNEAKHLPTDVVKVVDTTGAGDIFRGVLLSEYLTIKNLEASIKKALKIATESCKVKGVDNSIEQALEFI